ncbi:AbrB/MazE/SpoVT family DNA-binding domain-containing protein [Nitrosarchaeum sp. AC2]|uniref:AbrB/MazE/SpoVT family DNA-binding domain-containing protein n=1 Tax=Nitrosarchaeum sp. AC2 TaxID=2259673 RepID=UPI0015CA2E31|nr:AbrB/MazE/SpoVT family DNA-binding domain-containing protein [Nitrosarchaeum sp. AC2]
MIGGKSLGIILPKNWIDRLGMKKGTKLVLIISETEIVIKLHNEEYYSCPF